MPPGKVAKTSSDLSGRCFRVVKSAGRSPDNLKGLAKSEHKKEAVVELDGLKQTVNDLDDIEKHFRKRPDVILAVNPEQA